jgi:hypothetical protein
MLKPLTEAERAHREANRPRPYNLADEAETARLLRETLGYAHTSLHGKDGTDLTGREYAYFALRDALKQGYRLVPPSQST